MSKTRNKTKPIGKVARFTVRTANGEQVQLVATDRARRWAAELRFRQLNLPEDDPDRPEDFRYTVGHFEEGE